jgi:hypothetical protein
VVVGFDESGELGKTRSGEFDRRRQRAGRRTGQTQSGVLWDEHDQTVASHLAKARTETRLGFTAHPLRADSGDSDRAAGGEPPEQAVGST